MIARVGGAGWLRGSVARLGCLGEQLSEEPGEAPGLGRRPA
ncbi:hypothetical protein C3B54_111323 [Pontimonas salivibrio]|uniref:Uncharacterized protein n=1 Tax=Pontimonas salivibrio TaxID=1159327 RepID=A0A2L2BRI5_9MICO|nr:hypothetical protein C3B54_111323 [Pontimonas salivibrio]